MIRLAISGACLSEGALSDRNDVLKAFDLTFNSVAATLESMLRLVGADALADRVRPSKRRPGRTRIPYDEREEERRRTPRTRRERSDPSPKPTVVATSTVKRVTVKGSTVQKAVPPIKEEPASREPAVPLAGLREIPVRELQQVSIGPRTAVRDRTRTS